VARTSIDAGKPHHAICLQLRLRRRNFAPRHSFITKRNPAITWVNLFALINRVGHFAYAHQKLAVFGRFSNQSETEASPRTWLLRKSEI